MPDDQADHRGVPRPRRHADADLSRTLSHRIRQDSEDSDGCKRQRNRSEYGGKRGGRNAAARWIGRRPRRAYARSHPATAGRARALRGGRRRAIDAGGTAVLSTTAISGTGHSLKMAVLAPIPSTSVSRPTALNPGFFSRRQTAKRMSCCSVSRRKNGFEHPTFQTAFFRLSRVRVGTGCASSRRTTDTISGRQSRSRNTPSFQPIPLRIDSAIERLIARLAEFDCARAENSLACVTCLLEHTS